MEIIVAGEAYPIRVLPITTTYDVNFVGIWPRDLLAKAKDQRLKNFVKHRLPPFEAHEAS